MPRDLTTPLENVRHALASLGAWYLFVEIERRATPGTFFRLVNHSRAVYAANVWWQACAMDLTLPSEATDGNVPELSLTIPNVSRLGMAAVELDDELLGQTVRVAFDHESRTGLTNGTVPFLNSLTWKFRIIKATATESTLTIAAGLPPAFVTVPGRRFGRGNFPQLLARGAGGGS